MQEGKDPALETGQPLRPIWDWRLHITPPRPRRAAGSQPSRHPQVSPTLSRGAHPSLQRAAGDSISMRLPLTCGDTVYSWGATGQVFWEAEPGAGCRGEPSSKCGKETERALASELKRCLTALTWALDSQKEVSWDTWDASSPDSGMRCPLTGPSWAGRRPLHLRDGCFWGWASRKDGRRRLPVCSRPPRS